MSGWIAAGIIFSIFTIFLLVIFVRTLLFKPAPEETEKENVVEVNKEKIVEDMVEMIRCKTVSNRNEELVERKEFTKFEEVLQKKFSSYS